MTPMEEISRQCKIIRVSGNRKALQDIVLEVHAYKALEKDVPIETLKELEMWLKQVEKDKS